MSFQILLNIDLTNTGETSKLLWGQGKRNYESFSEKELEILQNYLEDVVNENPTALNFDLTKLNDFLWFDAEDYLKEYSKENEEEDEE